MSLDDLNPEPYILEMDDDLRTSYAQMRESEENWVAACGRKRGIQVQELAARRWVIVVAAGVALPDHDDMAATRQAFASDAREAAAEQGKKPTIGTRTTRMPEWADGSPLDERPSWVADRVRWRKHEAFRGGEISPAEALEVLEKRIETFDGYMQNAMRESHEDRAVRLRHRLEAVEQAYKEAKAVLSQNGDFTAMIRSGQALRLSIRGRDADDEPLSLDESVPAITLVPGTSETVLEEAPKRTRQRRYERVLDADGVIILKRT